jgi:hypothetical protein
MDGRPLEEFVQRIRDLIAGGEIEQALDQLKSLLRTDTMPGSSGSPVFNDMWQVIAVHHAVGRLSKGGDGRTRYVNEGVLMSAIMPDASDFWPKSEP